MDFITNLPLMDKGEGYLWVIINQLGKGVTLEAMEKRINQEIQAYLYNYVTYSQKD
ncbi:hypothetical protein K456DRAFT_1730942 [Colletotrichum gloeosporioides 23]|nr:hypothetical protein K456DRAFT_1730942 [Colletotrichum gloeosporioides 23]